MLQTKKVKIMKTVESDVKNMDEEIKSLKIDIKKSNELYEMLK